MHSERALSYDHRIIGDSTKDVHTRKNSLMRETNQESGVAALLFSSSIQQRTKGGYAPRVWLPAMFDYFVFIYSVWHIYVTS